MAEEFQGDSQSIRRASRTEVSRVLGIGSRLRKTEDRAFEDLALVLALIPDLGEWNPQEKEEVIQIIRAKSSADESRYACLLQRQTKLRAALIRLGEASATIS
jgi:hypothetical protein